MQYLQRIALLGVLLISTQRALANDSPSSPLTAADEDVVLASFDGGRITLADLQAAIDCKSRDVRASIARDNGRARLLTRMIDYDLLAREAERRGYRNHSAVTQVLSRASVDHLMEVEEAAATVDPKSPQVEAYFVQHATDYQRPPLRRASHIQLDDAAAAEALRISLIGASRERFANVARQRSRDVATRKQGGELGFCDAEGRPWEGTAANGCAPAIAKTLFTLPNIGAIAPQVVAHDGAFSVVMWTGAMPPKLPTLDRTRRKIAITLTDAARAAQLEALVTRLRAERPVQSHPEPLDTLVLPEPKPIDQPAGVPAAPPDPRAPTQTATDN